MATGRDPSNEKLEAFLRTLLGTNHAQRGLGEGVKATRPPLRLALSGHYFFVAEAAPVASPPSVRLTTKFSSEP